MFTFQSVAIMAKQVLPNLVQEHIGSIKSIEYNELYKLNEYMNNIFNIFNIYIYILPRLTCHLLLKNGNREKEKKGKNV